MGRRVRGCEFELLKIRGASYEKEKVRGAKSKEVRVAKSRDSRYELKELRYAIVPGKPCGIFEISSEGTADSGGRAGGWQLWGLPFRPASLPRLIYWV